MTPLLICLLLILTFTIILSFLGQFLPNPQPSSNKNSPYECGFDPLNSSRLPISFRFFLVSLLFILFDLEVALLLPLTFSFFLINYITQFIILTCFLSLLSLGLLFEWMGGGLEWAQ
uniref:NADH-ubiquinone oxidoreductase chain 3 n=1 Tax=Aspidophiura sp. TaxID=3135528 RepID=A0AAU6QDI4_9ECHI